MAWVEQHGDGWRVGWRVGGRGSRIEHGDTRGTKVLAMADKRAVETRVAATKRTRGIALEWDELTARFLASRESVTTAAHRDQMRRCLKALQAEHGWKTTADVRPAECLGLRPYHVRVLRALLRYASLADQVVDARCLVVRSLAKVGRKAPSVLLTDQQVADLIATASLWSPGDGAIAHMIAVYGLRAESLTGLPCSSLRRDALALRVKSGDDIALPLRADSAELLRALLVLPGGELGPVAPDAPLFLSHLGRAWRSGKEFADWWGHNIGGPGRGVLDLRRWATTRQMAGSGQNARAVADAQGRRTVALVAQVYQRSTAEEQREVFASLSDLPAPSPVLPGAPTRRHKSSVGQ
jgi:integrase